MKAHGSETVARSQRASMGTQEARSTLHQELLSAIKKRYISFSRESCPGDEFLQKTSTKDSITYALESISGQSLPSLIRMW